MNTHTYNEILQQPRVWKKEFDALLKDQEKINDFVSNHFESPDSEIIFSGAGTSAYIGDVLSVLYANRGYRNCRSVSTTDIISHPKEYLPVNKKVVLVSFASSGNSPESIATVKLANKLCKEIVHVFITCNSEGILAQSASADDLLILLPAETNDKSLAMTSSFSTMLLTGLLLTDIKDLEKKESEIDELCSRAQMVFDTYMEQIKELSKRPFSRAIFLGSGELKGIAEECHLKLQEMTDGKVICKFDSFLGFRHGPKAAINEETLLIYFFSDDDYVFAYEKDLIEQVNTNNAVIGQIAVTGKHRDIPGVNLDVIINTSGGRGKPNSYNFIAMVLVGQLLAFYKSVNLNFNPDSPSVSGNISRVVEGVVVYPY
jgi:tagatose-6-phosphate ketose/aldose isomerase